MSLSTVIKADSRDRRYPIVFFSQTGDPVTPLVSAQKMRDGFGSDSARLLIQDGSVVRAVPPL